jgi:hypothetical protein
VSARDDYPRLRAMSEWLPHTVNEEQLGRALDEIDYLREVLGIAERALRDQPMQAFRTEEARKRRAYGITAAREALRLDGKR